MKKIFRIFLVVLFAVVLVGTFVFLWKKTQPVKVVYNIVTPVIDTLEKSAVATGKVEPRDEVLIKPQISGIVSEVLREAGEMVRQGDVIAMVKVIPEMGQLNSAQSRLAVAKINLEQIVRDNERVLKLFESGVVSKEENEKSKTELLRAQEEVQTSQDNVEIIQNGIASRSKEFSNTQIRATITGMILDVPIKVGNSVIQSNNFNDGTTIATIADLGDMIFRGKVDETEVGKLKEGMLVKITIGALQDVNLEAALEYVAPKGVEENGVVLFEIKAATKVPSDIFVRAGYSANAEIITDRKQGVLSIPESTVEFENEKSYVHVLTSDTTQTKEQLFERREITLGLSDGINVEVIKGLVGKESLRGSIVDKKKK